MPLVGLLLQLPWRWLLLLLSPARLLSRLVSLRLKSLLPLLFLVRLQLRWSPLLLPLA